jgi:hypothetical protein
MARSVSLNRMWKLLLVVGILAAILATPGPTSASASHQARADLTYASAAFDRSLTALPAGAWYGLGGDRTVGWQAIGEVGGDRFDVSPLSVILSAFYAEPNGDAILVTWETATELDNSGFNLWRGTSEFGPDIQLNATLIPSQGPGSPGGFIYTWEDRYNLVSTTTYYYWLDSVDFAGVSTRHGPVNVTYDPPTAVGLAGFSAEPPSPRSAPPGAVTFAATFALAVAVWLRRRRQRRPRHA